MGIMFGRKAAKRVEAQQQEIAALKSQLAELDQKGRAELVTHSLKTRERIAGHVLRLGSKRTRQARPPEQSDINANLAKLEQMFPNVFPSWKRWFRKVAFENKKGLPGGLRV